MSLVVPFEEIFKEEKGPFCKHASWERVKLNVVIAILNGFAFKSKLFSKEYGFPLIRIRDILKNQTETFYTGDFSDEYVVSYGDLLIGMDGNFICSEWKGDKSLLNQRVCKIIPNENFISKRFLLYGINGYLKAIQEATSSVTVGHLSSKDILRIPFPLPPLKEQQRIIAKLEKLLEKVDQCKARLEKIPIILKRFRQSVLAAACSGELTKDWRKKNPEIETASELIDRVKREEKKDYLQECAIAEKNGFRRPKKPPLLSLREITIHLINTWANLKIEYAFLPQNIFDGPFGSNLKTSDYTDFGARVIRLENIGSLTFIDGKKTYISDYKYKELERHIVKEGDIIFASFISDSVRVVILPKIGKAIAKADCFCLRPIPQLLNYKYLTFILSSPQIYSELADVIHGATRPRINTKQLKGCSIPFPPIKEQQEIVRRVEALFKVADRIESRYKKARVYVDKLTQSILAKAFRGELVPQDPNDEPASKLLERIRAEREKLDAEKPKRTRAARKPKPRKRKTQPV